MNNVRAGSVIPLPSKRDFPCLLKATAPRLLVSVRSRPEAILAIDGGAQILDIKEPANGSLGMARIEVIREIAEFTASRSIPLSVALGELQDWANRVSLPSLPNEVSLAKLGLSGCAGRDWQTEWVRLREEFDRHRGRALRWVAVAYADEAAAMSPQLHEVVDAAAKTQCAGLLIDTFAKMGRTLLDFVSPSALKAIAEQCHSSGMFLALAGSLTGDSLSVLRNIDADIVAIRSAACRNANRNCGVDASLVTEFLNQLAPRMEGVG